MGRLLAAYGKPLGLGLALCVVWVASGVLADARPTALEERGAGSAPAPPASEGAATAGTSARAARPGRYVAGPVVGGGTVVIRCALAKAVDVIEFPLEKDTGPSRCGHDTLKSERAVFDPSSLALANCVVWVDGILQGKAFEGPMAQAAQEIVLDQKGCRYVPHVMVVRQGALLSIKNSDPVQHNIQGFFKDKSRTEFNPMSSSNSLLPPSDDTTLRKAGHYILGCSIHPWMTGYIWSVAHPYYGVTGPDGTVTLTDVPPGTHTIACWHEGMEMSVQTEGAKIIGYRFSGDFTVPPRQVTVTAGGTHEIVFTIDPR